MDINQDDRHGGPYDRGAADAYYRRPRAPHYFYGDSYETPKVSEADMTVDELVAYHQGYDETMDDGVHKEW